MTSPSVPIPTAEPRELIAGDTWLWNRVFSRFPSSAWALTYYIRGASAIDIVAGADPDTVTYNIVKAASLTAAVIGGAYKWIARVNSLTTLEVYTVEEGDFQIIANVQTAAAGALQPNAEIMLAAVEAEIAARLGQVASSNGGPASVATSPGSAHNEIEIAGRRLNKIPLVGRDGLFSLRRAYKSEIAMLENGGTLPDIAAVFQGTRHGGPFLFDAP